MAKENPWETIWGRGASAASTSTPRQDPHERERRRLLAWWAEHPWNWLTGIDTTSPDEQYPDGRPIILTTDELDEEAPIKAFPAKDYLRRYVDLIHQEQFVLVDKARQMMISTTSLLYIDWHCRFRPNRRWIVSKRTEDESVEMLQDKVRNVHPRLPEWVQAASPQRPKPVKKVRYPEVTIPGFGRAGGGYILAANEKMAEGAARGGTASGVFVDEGARQDRFGAIISASLPMAAKLIAVSTAEIGTPGARVYKAYLQEGLVAA